MKTTFIFILVYGLTTNAQTITTCPPGKYCSDTKEYDCPPNTYSTTGQWDCLPCPQGYTCRNGVISGLCDENQYSLIGQESCVTCQSDEVCNRLGLPHSCAVGFKVENNKCVLDDTINYFCKPGWWCDTDGNTGPCPPGSYAAGNQCTRCEKGKYCPYAELSTGFACVDGYYAPYEGMIECFPCPAGSSCSADRASACSIGQFSLAGSSTCTSCPDGHVCHGQKGYTICPDGTYANNNECTDCENGSYCLGGTKYTCPTGLYSTSKSVVCELCPAGFECSTTTYTQCTKGEYSALGETSCQSCPAGYYCPVEGADFEPGDVIVCPLGHYCTAGQDAPEECPEHTYGPTVGQTRVADCQVCPAGFYCPEGTAGFPSALHICPLGHFCEANQAPQLCPAGSYNSLHGATSADDCEPCQPGHICALGSTHSQPCPVGYFCPKSGQSQPIACPPGTFNGGTGARDSAKCRLCPAGHFCCDPDVPAWVPATNGGVTCRGASTEPVACPSGSYQANKGQFTCDYCPPGKRCTTSGLSHPDEDCEYGTFCPLGTKTDGEKCPAGTYTDFSNATSFDDCFNCPAGLYCDNANGNTFMLTNQQPTACPVGHYCLDQTPASDTYPCPAGSFSTETSLINSTQCTNCTEGYFCPEGLGIAPDIDYICPSGHFCPEGTAGNDADDVRIPACPAGTYLDDTGKTRVEDCLVCPVGEFCSEGVDEGQRCPDGYYSNEQGVTSQADCNRCPGGYKCKSIGDAPILEPAVCGAGFYSAPGADECTECIMGHYCDLNTTSEEAMLYFKVCPEGTFCDVGTDHIPDLVVDECELGFWCAKGDVKAYGGEQQPCPPGSYGARTGLTNAFECEPCPAGVYCDGWGMTCENRMINNGVLADPTNCDWKVCDAGHYCEKGSDSMSQCGPGFYRSDSTVQAAVNQTSCTLCESGYYCDNAGMSETDMKANECPKGSYCAPGSIIPEKCDIGTYGDSTMYKTSQECKACEPGYYCPVRGMSDDYIGDANYECVPGFYCASGASIKNPLDGISGDICPKGRYCPGGSSAPESCAPGQFTPFEGASEINDCTECYPGYYCPGEAESEFMLPCVAGFYCQPGSTTADELDECTPGHYCPQLPIEDENRDELTQLIGAQHEVPCNPGTFAEAKQQAKCDLCPAGRWCPRSKMATTYPCPKGHYCELGSVDPTPCGVGTFNPNEEAFNELFCLTCSPGHYCNSRGLAAPTGDCPTGYDCSSGGVIDPFNGDYACQPGQICFPSDDGQTTSVDKCPAGTFNPRLHGQGEDDCLECTPGMACTSDGLDEPNDQCEAKYYCGGGADRTTPSGPTGAVKECGLGYYCPLGSPAQKPCELGTYGDGTRSEQCAECIDGYYCRGTIAYDNTNPQGAMSICEPGFECDAEYPFPCQPGTFNDQYSGQCQPCSAGHFCPRFGQDGVRNGETCSNGFLCGTGNRTPTPAAGLCPEGEICIDGESAECNVGSMSTAKVLGAQGDCTQCPGGYFCDESVTQWDDLWNDASGDFNINYKCDEGHFCKSGCTKSDPLSSSDCNRDESQTGGKCRSNDAFCPVATMGEITCRENYFLKIDGIQAQCAPCEEGNYCTAGKSRTCPRGFYCPGGDDAVAEGYQGMIPCQPGTYSRTLGGTNSTVCESCKPGFYCPEYGMADYTECEAGFYCEGGTKHQRPNDINGSYCPVGSFCPAGSESPTPCTAGHYCNQPGLAQLSDRHCAPGYYCEGGDISATPHDGDEPELCPAGYYCPNVDNEPKKLCPAGRFSPADVTGLRSEVDCMPCPAGFYCSGVIPADGAVPTPVACPAGYVCPPGSKSFTIGNNDCDWSSSDNPVLICPKGHQCPPGTASAQPCPPGSFADSCGTKECRPCRERYFCKEQGESEELCNRGSFCPAETGSPIPCPPGTYGPENTNGICEQCPPGFYCEYPTDTFPNTTGLLEPTAECEDGYECIIGSITPTPMDGVMGQLCPQGYYCEKGLKEPCPSGKYGDRVGLKSELECTECPNGFDCTSTGISDLTEHYCNAGYYCLKGQPPAKCQKEGRYCPEGTGQADGYGCPSGTWSDDKTDDDVNSFCFSCTIGSVCDYDNTTQVSIKADCPDGYYCPSGSATTTARGCPAGTHGERLGLARITECVPCPAGYYCPYATGPLGSLTRPPFECQDGFACVLGSTTPTPDGISGDDTNGPCPAGHYCPKGKMTKCPVGTYQPNTAGEKLDDCQPCPAGRYCGTEAMVTSEAGFTCAAGYYCFANASQRRPDDDPSGYAGECTPGHYCPQGATHQHECTDGFYNDRNGQEDCTNECQQGYFCPPKSSSSSQQRCPYGYECGIGTTPRSINSCQAGYYDGTDEADLIGLTEGKCSICPPGQFCQGEANTKESIIANQCEGGFYCSNQYEPGSWTSRPYCGDDLESSVYCNRAAFGTVCEVGSYCDEEAVEPSPCPENHYCPHFGIDSSVTGGNYDCEEGYHCKSGATVPNPDDQLNESEQNGEVCPNDWFCPSGQSPSLCDSNTYNPQLGISKLEDCKSCPPGEICTQGDDSIDREPCPAGDYCVDGDQNACSSGYVCEQGTQVENACNYGEYYANSQTECGECTTGNYCDGISKIDEDAEDNFDPVMTPEPCLDGYDCTSIGNKLNRETGCPPGTSGSNGQCETCPKGSYCPSIATESGSEPGCVSGYVCDGGANEPFGGTSTDIGGVECPEGNYCIDGLVQKCTSGFYRNQTRASSIESCLPCPGGFFCDGEENSDISRSLCSAGYFCPPDGYCSSGKDCSLDDESENDCGEFNFCEEGAAYPTTCVFGQFNNDDKNAKECKCCDDADLVDGECADNGSSNDEICKDGQRSDDCLEGYYCDDNTAILCPAGTYGTTGATKEDRCKLCEQGFYCDNQGSALTRPSIKVCEAGYICLEGSPVPRPEFEKDAADATYGYRCPVGHYCPAGTPTDPVTAPIECAEGTYRNEDRGTEEADCYPCPTGYYCPNKGMTDGNMNRCDEGSHCPVGSENPLDCDAGHYCPDGMAMIECEGGYYQKEKAKPNCDPCPGGFYCPEGEAAELPCPKGAYCPDRSQYPTYCDIGYYSDDEELSAYACDPCPAGKACPKIGSTSDDFVSCDDGYYCLPGSSNPRASECEPGFYCKDGIQTICDEGKACTDYGLSEPNYDCFPGYYCPSGSTSPELEENICPAGYYCEKGTADYTNNTCAIGTYNEHEGQQKETACIPCRAGYYCPNVAMTTFDEYPCEEGYFCPPGTSELNGDNICQSGQYCPRQSIIPLPCNDGEYSDETGADVCEPCEAGSYCSSITTDPATQYAVGPTRGEPCPYGYYCPDKTAIPKPCPRGYLGLELALSEVAECTECPPGHYCTYIGSSEATGPCAAGYYCPEDRSKFDSPMPNDYICPENHFCETGAIEPEPCAAGTHRNGEGGRSQTSCATCPPGKFCETGEAPQDCEGGYICNNGAQESNPTDGITGFICPQGYYCPVGAILPKPCPPGTYGDDEGLESCEEECEEGFYCPVGSTKSDERECLAGFYCEAGSEVGNPVDNTCEVGSFCETGSSSPEPCERGSFSAAIGSAECAQCPAGFMCGGGLPDGVTDEDKMNIVSCPAGSYCEIGSEEERDCPAGSFSAEKTARADLCSPCPAGDYCRPGTTNTMIENDETDCPPGYYCEEGTTNTERCLAGYECPGASPEAQPCEEGRISTRDYVTTCELCEEGFYCPRDPDTNDTTVSKLCEQGSYCLRNSSYPLSCPAGSFNENTGGKSISDCTACQEGFYCVSSTDGSGQSVCDDGYHCIEGSTSPRPGCVDAHDERGTICPLGFICESGLAEPCEAGKMCDKYGQSKNDTEDCLPGYYCPAGTVRETVPELDNDNLHPIQCGSEQTTTGVFCPAGSDKEQKCPEGTWSMSLGNREIYRSTSCIKCPEGMACTKEGIYNVSESGTPAAPGYYIAFQGATTSKPDDATGNQCTDQTYCPSGTKNPIDCPPGTHQPSKGRDSCNSCSSGKFCSGGLEGTRIQQSCLEGHYCPKDSYRPIPCPLGTYGNEGVTSYKSASNCRLCPPGRYCDQEASLYEKISAQFCEAGFFCSEGANSSRPNDAVYYDTDTNKWKGNGKCPIGFYCPEASSQPSPCPLGTYGIESGAEEERFQVGLFNDKKGCYPCPPGYYCDQLNMTTVDRSPESSLCPEKCPKLCQAGYYCPLGSSRGDGIRCSKGHYCPEGSPIEIPCPPGQYQGQVGASDGCTVCPAGKYCAGFEPKVEAISCTVGHYCPEGTADPIPCKPGTFNPGNGASDETSCLRCDTGFYCPHFGMGQLDEDFICSPGYVCQSGSVHPKPYDDESNEPCPVGHYCPNHFDINIYNRILTPQPCPRGRYNPSTHGQSVDDCLPCKGGQYCETTGLSAPTNLCPSGFYCPNTDDGTISPTEICPANHYCPEGTADPIPCPLGYYQLTRGSDQCKICEAGFYCPRESDSEDDVKPIKCNSVNKDDSKRAVYCEEGSEYEKPCPPGTYTTSSNAIGLVSASECKPCPFGKYCQEGAIQGACAGGFLCFSGADAPNPTYGKTTNNMTVVIRPYLDDQMIKYEVNQNLTIDGECPVGVVCAGPCPPGFYCYENSITGSSDLGACPYGTYRNQIGADSPEDCDTCPAGKECLSGDGQVYDCPPGYYCPTWYEGDESPEIIVFWQGPGEKTQYSLHPSPGRTPCPRFTYNDTGAAASIDDCHYCPPGYYCNDEAVGSLDNASCPEGYYCVGQGTPPALCPAGTMAPAGQIFTSLIDCLPCTPGFYCPPPSQFQPNIDGVICPPGYECPTGNRVPFLCEAGRFCPEPGLARGLSCEAGFYCPEGTINIFVNGSDDPLDPIQEESDYFCHFPYYCPPESPSRLFCQLGYEPIEKQGLRDSPSFCSICQSGTYRANYNETACLPCVPGFFCPEGSSNLGDNVCTEGHECPLGGRPTFANYDEDCWRDDEKDEVCCQIQSRPVFCYDPDAPIPCIPGTYSFGLGNERCAPCPANTLNQASKSSQCVNCGSTSRSAPGSTECECVGENRVHHASDGACVCRFGFTSNAEYANSLEDCSKRYLDDCNEYSSITQSCQGECPTGQLFSSAYQLCLDNEPVEPTLSDDYVMQAYTYNTESGTLIDELTGDAEFTDDILNFDQTMEKLMNDTTLSFESHLMTVTDQSFITSRIPKSLRFRRQSFADESVVDPILCVTPSTVLIFEFTAALGYPVFAVDSSLNTNPNFDLGEFRTLDYFTTRTNVNVDRFAFAFGEQVNNPEVYVFTHSNNPNSFFIVTIRDECNAEFSAVQNRSLQTLGLAGVTQVNAFDTPPNMALIIGLSSTAAILLVIGIIVFLYIDPFGWAVFSTERFKPKYKELSEPIVSSQMKKMKTDEIESLRPYAIVYGENELEDFNVHNFLDKLRDQQRMVKQQLEEVNESLNNMNETMKNETNQLKQNVANMSTSLLQQQHHSDASRTEYTVGRTHVNAKLRMTPGQLTDSEDRLFGALQDFLNKMHQGRLHINDEMIDKAKKLYRKGKKDQDAVDGAETKKLEKAELTFAGTEETLELDMDDFVTDLSLDFEDEIIPFAVPKDTNDYSAALAEYESDLLDHENRLQSEREKQRWLLRQKMKERQRKRGLASDDNELSREMCDAENALTAVKVEAENEIKSEMNKLAEQFNDDFDRLIADQDISEDDKAKLHEITSNINDEIEQKEEDLLNAFKDRQRRRKQRKQKDLEDICDNDQLQHELDQLDKQFELEEMHFEQQVHDDLIDAAFNQKQQACADYISKNSNKNGAEVVEMLNKLEQQEDQLYARHLRNKKQAESLLRSRIEQRQKDKVRDMLESSSSHAGSPASPIVELTTDYDQYGDTVGVDHLLQASREADERKMSELNAKYHNEMDKIDEVQRDEMHALDVELAMENAKLEADLSQAKTELIMNMSNDASDALLLKYTERSNQLRAQQQADQMKRRKQLQLALAARRKKAERDVVDALNGDMCQQQSANEMKLAEHHKQQVVRAEMDLIRQALESVQDQPDVYGIVKRVLAKRHQEEANQLEDRFGLEREELLIKCSADQRDVALADWEYRYNQDKVNLKSTHYTELVDYLEKFSPEAAKQVTRKNAEIDAKRRQYEQDEAKLAQQLEHELAEFERAQAAEMAAKLAEEEKKIDADLRAERERLLKELENETVAKEKAAEEEREKAKELEEAKKRGADENEMASILEKWSEQEDKRAQEATLAQIQRKREIEKRLQARKQTHTMDVTENLEKEKETKRKEIELANIEAKAVVLEKLDHVDDQMTKQAVEVIEEVVVAETSSNKESSNEQLSEEQFEAKLKASTLVETLNLLKQYLPNDTIDELYTVDDDNYSDDVHPCLSESLDRHEKLALRFARCISSLLSALDLMRPISLLVASSLPRQNATLLANPFLHAYSYDSVNRILYVRRDFLAKATPGTISVAVQHACAHIHSGDLRSDNEPRFRAHLSRVLSSVAAFMLKLREDGSSSIDLNVFDEIDNHVTTSQMKLIFNGNKQINDNLDVANELESVNQAIARASRLGDVVSDELRQKQVTLQQIQRSRNNSTF